MLDLSKYRLLLAARRADLAQRLKKIDQELDSPHSNDWEEQAIEREDDEVLEGLGEQGHHELVLVDQALDRIAQGTFGDCLSCGDPISTKRLDLLPHAPLCRTCAAGG